MPLPLLTLKFERRYKWTIYIDNSNLHIEARRQSAVKKGYAENIFVAMNEGILDQSYTISFGRLYEFLVGENKSTVKKISLFGSRPPPNDSIWKFAEKAGFEVNLEDRNAANKEKKIDTGISVAMVRDALKFGKPTEDVFVLVAGDRDFVPVLKALKDDGFKTQVVFWGNVGKELKEASDKFICLDDHLDYLQY